MTVELERVREARRVLIEIIDETCVGEPISRTHNPDEFPGAVGSHGDPAWSALVEAKRQLTAYVQWAHGDEAWEMVRNEDG